MTKPKDPLIELKIEWDKKEEDFMVYYPSRADGHYGNSIISQRPLIMLSKESGEALGLTVMGKLEGTGYYIFEDHSLVEELDKRGYDTKTLKFSIKKKK